MHQHVDNFFKQVRLLRAKEASSDLVNGLFQLGQPVVVLFSIVSAKKRSTHTLETQAYVLVPFIAATAVHESAGRFLTS